MIGRIVSAQREELEREIGELKSKADRIAGEARELAGKCRFEKDSERDAPSTACGETPQPRFRASHPLQAG